MTMKKLLESEPEKKEADLHPSTAGEETAQFGFRKVLAKEKAHWVRNHFDTVAQKYDLMNTLLSFGVHYLWKRTAIRMLGLKPGDQVVDVCGGTGDLSILALKKTSMTGRIFLYDINRAMMEMGRYKSTHASFRKAILYIQGDAEHMAFKPESFDAAMVGFGIRNLTHMEEGFKEMHRVLKPGGRLMCLEFSKPIWPWFRWLYDFYSFRIMPLIGLLFVGSRQAYTYLPESIRLFPSPEELRRRLEEIGFHQVDYRILTNGIAVVHVGTKK